MSGEYDRAGEAVETALGIYRGIGDRGGTAEALNEAGTVHRLRGRLGQAEAAHREALEVARAIDSTWDEAHAWAGLGRCAQAGHRLSDARTCLERAQQAFRRIEADELPGIMAELDALGTSDQAPSST